METEEVINVNIGVLGHVDSGKTSFCASISTVLSTAALDKSPQSQARGITQDLQFSAFRVPKASISFNKDAKNEENALDSKTPVYSPESKHTVLNFTLVDCPGHASLIKTIIGGSSIIDMIILVIDVTKGIQTQTAEGIILAELVTKQMVVLLNKVDLIPLEERETRINSLKTRISKVLSGSGFSKLSFVPFAAKPSKGEDPIGLDYLRSVLSNIDVPERHLVEASFLMSVDHCFTIKGQGSVATGTLLRGSLQLNQLVELVGHFSTHKVKSMEVFKQRVKVVRQGERVGVLLPTLDSSLLERGLLAQPGSVSFATGLIVTLNKIRYFKSDLESGSKMHISIGHSTCLAKLSLFGIPSTESDASSSSTSSDHSDPSKSLPELSTATSYDFLKNLGSHHSSCFALLHLEKEIPVPSHSIYIASKLDADIHTNTCRLAFHGTVLYSFSDPSHSSSSSSTLAQSSSSSINKANTTISTASLPQVSISDLKIFTTKTKVGAIDRIVDDYVIIGRNLFKKETKMALFIGLPILVDGKKGVIDSSFGSSGKFKVRLSDPVAKSIPVNSEIILTLKKRKFDTKKGEKKR